jgi:hypothetical protein
MFIIELLKSWFYPYKYGLIDETDERDFGAHLIRGHVSKSDLTDKEFRVATVILIHQGSTDFCVGCSRAYGAQATEGKLMSWAGAYAMSCKILGYIPKYGTSILSMCKGAVSYGTPEEKYYKYSAVKGRNWFANHNNISKEGYDNAKKHKAQSYYRIYEPWGMDRFDTFRAYLNKFKDKKVVIHTGVDGHAVTLLGQKKKDGEMKIYGPDSYGKTSKNYRIGKSIDGIRYFNRSEANQLFQGYILFDMERELAEILKEYDGKVIKLEDSKKCYLVQGGEKRYIPDEDTAWSHGHLLAPYDGAKLVETVDKSDFDKIPDGDNLKFEGGKNEFIVRRIKEKYNIN